ncbi:IS200/IS605 family transposase [Hydrogenimonas thermophila]|uniref:Putative transposase n=1 Tax=Hydrogenimonas thermophila TaxID=223786 RepID=A0A1I5N8G1_9BACT|nr:IS200/IS605 family transposase [Hydrogenimonas thermophila]SFP17990.1 putative transposase [Hydrogenimonas thermophila]
MDKTLYKKNRHAIFRLKYHLVVVSKFKRDVINEEIAKRLQEIAKEIFEEAWKCEITNIEFKPNYVHIAFETQPQVQLSKLVNNFKTVSSRLIRKEFKEDVKKYYFDKSYFWAPSYCLLSVGNNANVIIDEYVNNLVEE